MAFADGKLQIGFAPEFLFQKESLDHNENVTLIDRIFSEKLGLPVHVKFSMLDGAGARQDREADEPIVKQALEAFKGKIVSKWHHEG